MNSVYCFFLSVDNLILIILNGICVHKIDVLDSVYSAYDRPTLIFENHIIFKVHFSSNFIRVKSSKLPSKKVKQFSDKFKHRPPPYALLLNDFAVYSTTFAPSVRYKVEFPCIKFSRDRKNLYGCTLLIVVGYTGAKKGSCFKFLGYQLI